MKKQAFPLIFFIKHLPYPFVFDYNIPDSKQEDIFLVQAAHRYSGRHL